MQHIVVVDAVVRHLESLVAEKYGGGSSNNDVAQPVGRKIQASNDGRRGKEERHTRLKLKAAFFYAEDGMVASIDLWWIHTTFNLLTGLFDRVGLKTNAKKPWGWCSTHVGWPGCSCIRSLYPADYRDMEELQ